MNNTIIFYHGNCPDGFGGAYAAWKKFGDTAEYIPLSRGAEPPYDLAKDADVYFIDFTYDSKEIMGRFVQEAKSLLVLDHHEGTRENTESVPNYVFDAKRSGASIAWDTFHPETPRPQLINHIEDDDLFAFAMEDTRPIIAYLGLQPFTFAFWDEVMTALENETTREPLLVKARLFAECFERLVALSVRQAKMVTFEGYTCAFATAHPYKPIKSQVGNELAKLHPPIALVVTAHPNGYGVSIRGNGAVDVSKIAAKFGGNGHPNSSGFLIPREGPFPWELIEDTHEDSGN